MTPQQFPGQTLAPIPAAAGAYSGDTDFTLAQKQTQILFNALGPGASGVPIVPPSTLTPATASTGTSAATPAGVSSLLVVFSSDFTGSFDGNTVDVKQTPSLSFTAPFGKSLPSYAIVTTAGSFWWETLT